VQVVLNRGMLNYGGDLYLGEKTPIVIGAEGLGEDARINLNKITAYIDLLAEEGTRIGEPATKHLDGVI